MSLGNRLRSAFGPAAGIVVLGAPALMCAHEFLSGFNSDGGLTEEGAVMVGMVGFIFMLATGAGAAGCAVWAGARFFNPPSPAAAKNTTSAPAPIVV